MMSSLYDIYPQSKAAKSVEKKAEYELVRAEKSVSEIKAKILGLMKEAKTE